MATMKKIMEGWRDYEKEALKEVRYNPYGDEIRKNQARAQGRPEPKPTTTPIQLPATTAMRALSAGTYGALEAARENYPLATAAAEIILGFVPVVGQLIDSADVGAATARGEYGDATIGAIAFIPGLGDAVKILKRPGVRKALTMGTEAAAEAIAKLLKADPGFAQQLKKVAGDFAHDHGVDLLDAGQRQMALGNAAQVASVHVPPDYSAAQGQAAISAASDASATFDKEGHGQELRDDQAQEEYWQAGSAGPMLADMGEEAPYRAVSGDSLSKIAADKGFSTDELIAANPQIEDPGQIEIDQEINLPAAKA